MHKLAGRDELEIPLKAKIDGDYTKNLSFLLDVKIFLKTIIKVFESDGVVEGKIEKEEKNSEENFNNGQK